MIKTKLFTIAIFMFALKAFGQETPGTNVTSGKITFEEKVKLEIKLEGEAAALAADLPKERKTEKVLTFNQDASLFEELKTVDEDMSASQEGGVRFKMVIGGQSKIFTDLKNQKVIEQRDFMNRMFLVEKPMPEMNWKITGNQKVILDYPCMEAFRLDTAGVKTIVWFAPSITVKSGPSGFCNLPGMVLEADINNGSRHYTAKNIQQVPPDKLKLQRPREGKAVSEGEFKDIVAAKMKEMGIENGGQGGGTQMHVIIKKN
jgi:GLPGLI family protein